MSPGDIDSKLNTSGTAQIPGQRIKYPDICHTGSMCYDVFCLSWYFAPTKKVFRI
jgi:hypothetical protein